LEPTLPGRSSTDTGSPVPAARWSTNAHSGWCPKPRLFSALVVDLALEAGGAACDLGEGGHAEVGGAGVGGDLVELIEFLSGAVEADLQAVELAEPALLAGLGDAGDQVVADLDQSGLLSRVWAQQRAAQAGFSELATGLRVGLRLRRVSELDRGHRRARRASMPWACGRTGAGDGGRRQRPSAPGRRAEGPGPARR
jgi:hypothetical protein